MLITGVAKMLECNTRFDWHSATLKAEYACEWKTMTEASTTKRLVTASLEPLKSVILPGFAVH